MKKIGKMIVGCWGSHGIVIEFSWNSYWIFKLPASFQQTSPSSIVADRHEAVAFDDLRWRLVRNIASIDYCVGLQHDLVHYAGLKANT
jgi:hypothetical protein